MPIRTAESYTVIATGRRSVRAFIASSKYLKRRKDWRKRRWIVSRGPWFNRRCLFLKAVPKSGGDALVLLPGWKLLHIRTVAMNAFETLKPIVIHKPGGVVKHGNSQRCLAAVHRLRRQGKVPKNCELCGCERKLVAHHWNGYDYADDVWWICHPCNTSLVGPEAHSGLVSKEEIRRVIRSGLTDGGQYTRRRIHIMV